MVARSLNENASRNTLIRLPQYYEKHHETACFLAPSSSLPRMLAHSSTFFAFRALSPPCTSGTLSIALQPRGWWIGEGTSSHSVGPCCRIVTTSPGTTWIRITILIRDSSKEPFLW